MPTVRTSGRVTLITAVFYANLVSLAAQVVWVREITHLFGATAGVFASVLAVVLTGLASGAAWSGRRAAAVPRPERLLAILLVALGVLCAASLPLLDLARSLFLALTHEGMAPITRATLRLPVIALVLLPPTFAIGAILPLTTHLYSRFSAGAVASIYASDTLGAAVGALLGGFVLVPHVGLNASTWLLGAGAIGVAALVHRSAPASAPAVVAVPVRNQPPGPARKKKGYQGKEAGQAESSVVPELGPRARLAVLVSFFLTGAAALLLETGWNRFFYLLNGTSIYSLSTVLAGFLTGIGLGSALVRRRLERGGDVTLLVAFLQATVALGGLLVFRSQELFERIYLTLFQDMDTYFGFQLGIYVTVFALVGLATLAMGANFPAVVRLLAPRRDEEAGTLGRVYFINTAGAVAGALAGEFLLLPRLGFEGLIATVVLIYLGSAVLFWWLAPAPARRRALVPIGVVGAAALLLTPPIRPYEAPWNALYYSGIRQGTYAKYEDLNNAHTVVYRRQGFYGQVTVSRTTAGELYLKHNGKTDASTNRSDNFAQYLVGHLPMLVHPNPERVVNIGLGGGFTLGAITAHEEPREIVLVELDPLVVEATDTWFSEASRHALRDPRVRVAIDDGRSFIERGSDKFDVVVSEPPNIWVSGVSGLFTAEFYRAVRERLRPGGILCQWLPLYELSEDDFATALATMATEFKHFAAWTNGTVALVIASADPLPLERATPRRLTTATATDLQGVGIMPWEVDQFVAQPDLEEKEIAEFQAAARDLSRDDLPVLEFRSARNLFYFNKPGGAKRWADRLRRVH